MNNKLEGKGIKLLSNLDYFVGDFKDGKIHGKGKYYNNQNGFIYEGEYD